MWEQGGSKDTEMERTWSETVTLCGSPPLLGTEPPRWAGQIFIQVYDKKGEGNRWAPKEDLIYSSVDKVLHYVCSNYCRSRFSILYFTYVLNALQRWLCRWILLRVTGSAVSDYSAFLLHGKIDNLATANIDRSWNWKGDFHTKVFSPLAALCCCS